MECCSTCCSQFHCPLCDLFFQLYFNCGVTLKNMQKKVKVRHAVCNLKIKCQDNAWLDYKINICWGGHIRGGHWWDLFFFFFLELVFWILQLIILLIYIFSGRRAAGWGLSQTCWCGHTSRGVSFFSIYWSDTVGAAAMVQTFFCLFHRTRLKIAFFMIADMQQSVICNM